MIIGAAEAYRAVFKGTQAETVLDDLAQFMGMTTDSAVRAGRADMLRRIWLMRSGRYDAKERDD